MYTKYIARLSITGRLDLWKSDDLAHLDYFKAGYGILTTQAYSIVDFAMD